MRKGLKRCGLLQQQRRGESFSEKVFIPKNFKKEAEASAASERIRGLLDPIRNWCHTQKRPASSTQISSMPKKNMEKKKVFFL